MIVLYNFAIFVVLACAIWIAGTRLTIYADAISDKFRIGKAFTGLVFLAIVTELPEIVTTITAAISGNALLIMNNMFGGIVMQTAILGVADFFALGANTFVFSAEIDSRARRCFFDPSSVIDFMRSHSWGH